MDSHRSSLLLPRPSSPSLRPRSPARGYEPFGGQDLHDSGLCSQLVLFFSDIPRALLVISCLTALIVIIVIVTLAEAVHTHGTCDMPASSSQSPSQQLTTCGTSGLDFSSLSASDLHFSSALWTLWLRPCGAVVSSACPAGSQGCLVSSQSQSIDFGPYSASSGAWSLLQSGVAQYSVSSSSSSLCGSSPYALLVRYECMQTATSPRVYSLTQPYSCHFIAVVHTNIACAAEQQPTDAAAAARDGSRQQPVM